MRGIPGILVLALAAHAEPDGAVAEPARWTGPHGPPGRTRCSRAMPITRDVVEAWARPLPGAAAAPPVTWDGTLYVLCEAARGHQLLAVDITSGRTLARKVLRDAPLRAIHVWGGVVVVQTSDARITGLKRVGKSFLEEWKYSRGPDRKTLFRPDSFTVVENEIYVVSRGALLRVAPGLATPVWSQDESYVGPPAVYGNSVLVYAGRLGRIVSIDRTSGLQLGRSGRIIDGHGHCGITVGRKRILVRAPDPIPIEGGQASDCFVDHSLDGGGLRPGRVLGCLSFRVAPAVYGDGFLTCEGRNEWQWWKDEGGEVLAQRKYTPDLFGNLVAPTVLGKVVYFGRWAADIETNEIFWRLPVARVRFGAIPADRLCMVVEPGEPETLRAYRSRVGR